MLFNIQLFKMLVLQIHVFFATLKQRLTKLLNYPFHSVENKIMTTIEHLALLIKYTAHIND